MSAKLTPWYSPEIKPVRIGEYNATTVPVCDYAYELRRWWDGAAWCAPYFVSDTEPRKVAFRNRWDWNSNQSLIHWRGLAREPK